MNRNYSHDFESFEDHTWLNCAHQGPLPHRAAEEAREAITWKTSPYKLTTERFETIPIRVKKALAQLINVNADEIVLGNSASYSLHLLANGIPWEVGDEVLLVKGDFPSDILPWLALKKQGVKVRFVKPENNLPTAAELERNITPKTRLFCSTWVHSFSGMTANLSALGKVCQDNDITFVVNGSQALGARPLTVSEVPIDALIGVGFKWLCGPYGTGFCWMKSDLLQSLEYNKAYWLSEMTSEGLSKESGEISLPEGPAKAQKYDVFGTANFFNFKPWAASVEYLLEQGIDRVAEHDQQLVSQLINGLNFDKYELLSPRKGPERSTLVFISYKDGKHNSEIYSLLKNKDINIAFRRGKLRLSPHLYNSQEDIEKVLAVLDTT